MEAPTLTDSKQLFGAVPCETVLLGAVEQLDVENELLVWLLQVERPIRVVLTDQLLL